MTSYIRNIIIVGIAASLAVSALPKNGEQSGKYVKYMASFLILAVILSPLKGIAGSLDTFEEALSELTQNPNTENYETLTDPVIEKTAETIAKYVLSICKNKFGIDTETAKVKVILYDSDTENVEISELHIYTSEKDRELLDDIEEHFEEIFGSKVYAFGP